MSEVLNVNINEDPRLLFEKYDVSTIKKIKESAQTEIEHKQNVLRQFIGDNYKPVLETPPVLKDIQTIFEDTRQTLSKITEYSKNFNSDGEIQERRQASPYSEVSQLYMNALDCLDNNKFVESLQNSELAKEKLKLIEGTSYVAISLRVTIDSLPSRILTTIKNYLENPNSTFSSPILSDCYTTLMKFNKVKRLKLSNPFEFIKEALIQRNKKLFEEIGQINDICQKFLLVLESSIAFLSTVHEDSTDFIDTITNSFSNSDTSHVTNIELRDLFRHAKSIQDLANSTLNSPNIISFLNETAISSDFWKTAFLPIFKKLASSSLKQTIDNLRINEKLSEILSNNTIDSFNATKFSLNSQEDLKLRSLGLPPIITEFKSSLENTFLVLSSQLQSQITQIATLDMIRAPLNEVLSKCCKLLSISLSSASSGTSIPLTVYHLCGALASPSIVSILSENSASSRSIKELTRIQEKSAQLWASSIATKLADDYLSTTPGSSFSYLVSLEKKILEAAGHINTQVCAKNMRNEARKAVAEKLGQILENLTLQGGSEARSIAESKATNLFKDYCLFDMVLSMQNASVDLRPSFIEKMDPTKFHENEKKFVDEAKATLASSGELLKLMSGGKLIALKSSNKVDVNSKVNNLFSKRLKSQ